MADIINLNKFRKSKARAEKKQQADENAVQFGRNKRQKTHDTAQTEKLHKDVDDHKLDLGDHKSSHLGRGDLKPDKDET